MSPFYTSWLLTEALMKLRGPPISVYPRLRAVPSWSSRSSQYPQRGLIQTDPPLWVGSYYLSVTTERPEKTGT